MFILSLRFRTQEVAIVLNESLLIIDSFSEQVGLILAINAFATVLSRFIIAQVDVLSLICGNVIRVAAQVRLTVLRSIIASTPHHAYWTSIVLDPLKDSLRPVMLFGVHLSGLAAEVIVVHVVGVRQFCCLAVRYKKKSKSWLEDSYIKCEI